MKTTTNKIKRRRMSLRSQFLVLMLLLGAISVALSIYAFTQEQVRDSHEHIEREIKSLMTLSQGALQRSLRYQALSAFDEIMSELEAHRRIRAVGIFNTAGEEVFSFGANGNMQPLLQQFPHINMKTFLRTHSELQLNLEHNKSSNSYFAYIPIASVPDAFQETHYDILVLEYLVPITWYDAFLIQLPYLLTWIGIFLTALTLLLLYLNYKVARPARSIVDNIAAVERGDVGALKPVYGADELVQIDQAFAAMVAERAKNEAQLIKLSTAVEQSHEGVVITDRLGNIEYVNQALVDNTGYSREELLGSNPRMLSSGKTPRATFIALWNHITSGKAWTGELHNRRRDGTEFIELQTISPLKNAQGDITHYVGVRQDITEQKSIQERLNFLAYFDVLTHLPNRVSVLEQLQAQGEQSIAHGTIGAFLLINVDRLKVINDGRGFEFGNQVIVALSKRLLSLKDKGMLLGHLGADTFCIILPARLSDPAQARTLAEEFATFLVKKCAEPFQIEDEEMSLTISIGIRLIDEGESAEGCIRSAETAVHNAKEKGGNQWFFYRSVDGKHAEFVFSIEGELREAIKSHQLRCFLQAQVNEQGKLTGAESLVRWHHPERGMVSPGDFITVAELSDLIVDIDRWMLARALQILAQWQYDKRNLTMAVNISPRHLRRPEFVQEVLALVEQAGASTEGLVLEVTEGLLVDDMVGSIEKMKTLKSHGVQFAIDDFGTGYSSLSYIRELPVDEIKIDQSFTRGLPNSPVDVAMVSSIISVSQNLGLRVLAEGIETEEQADFCRKNRMWGQGYYYDRPVDEAAWQKKWLK